MILPISMVWRADATGITPQNSRSLPLALSFPDISDSFGIVIKYCPRTAGLGSWLLKAARPADTAVTMASTRDALPARHRVLAGGGCRSMLIGRSAKFNRPNWSTRGTSSIFGLFGQRLDHVPTFPHPESPQRPARRHDRAADQTALREHLGAGHRQSRRRLALQFLCLLPRQR